nr:putative ribonuclease H-like domain-containing protein [Tanacetum cinerariifolium]
MDESIPWDKKCKSSIENFKVKAYIDTVFNGVELSKEKIARKTYSSYQDPLIQNTIEAKFSLEISRINAGLEQFHKCLNEEMVADLRYFKSLELEVDSLISQLETQKTQFLNEIDRISMEYYYVDHMNAILSVYTEFDELVEIVLFIVEFGCSKHMTGNLKLLINFVEKFLGTVKFGNDQIAPILGYGDQNDIVVGLPMLKFIKDYLCSSCELGKSKRKSFHTKLTPRVIPTTSVSIPQLKNNPQGDRVLRSNSHGKKLEVEEHRRNVKLSKNNMYVTACNDSLNAKTVNVKSVSAMCAKCVMIVKHDVCVPKSVVKPLKKIVASKSIKKPRNNVRKLHECFGKIYKWSYIKFTPSGYMWKPKSKQANVNPNVSMPLGNASRSANVKDTMTSRRSIVSNTPFSSNSFAAPRDCSIHRMTKLHLFLDMEIWSKDETPEVLIDFLRLVQRGLQAQVRIVRIDKGTEFLNQTLHAYFAAEGVLHQMSVARTPEQNDVVKRQNQTLVEAARTMLSATKVLLFFWAEVSDLILLSCCGVYFQ